MRDHVLRLEPTLEPYKAESEPVDEVAVLLLTLRLGKPFFR